MTKHDDDVRLDLGVRNLDALFQQGVPRGSAIVVAGPPGSGKTILTQQICFHNATAERPVLYFSTLSEPTAKTLRHLTQFTFFDDKKLEAAVFWSDLGGLLRTKGLDVTSSLIMERIKKVKPAIVVIDSFKALDDLATSKEELRKFSYELAVNLMAWETTTFLLGEYESHDIHTSPLFSIVDGLILLGQHEQSGENQRFIQVVKMRGTNHNRDEHPFVITPHGIDVFAPRVSIPRAERDSGGHRCKTGISKLDLLLGDGIPRGSSLLISGVAGTGKTVLLLEFLYRGALAGEKGIIFSFEETSDRLRASAHGLGWDLDAQIESGMLEIVFIPQPEIMIESDLMMIRERVEALGAQRVAVDSVSVFLHKVKEPQIAREKIFQLASIVQNSAAVGFFATDIPYGRRQLSRFGVEETVVDGVILLSSTEQGLDRERYLEVYKLRNTAHLKGRHTMAIGRGGITIFPRYRVESDVVGQPSPAKPTRRIPSGIAGLDKLWEGGLLERSVTLVSGSAGIGKSTFGLQFLVEGLKRGEPGLYVSLEEGPAQLLQTAEALGLALREPIKDGLCEILHLSRLQARASQFLAILADKIQSKKVRRLVLDGVRHIVTDGKLPEDLRQLLAALITRFKALDVTSVLTIESSSLYSTGTITDEGFSAVADNIVMLRYIPTAGEDRPSLSVVKTRGTAHDRGVYHYSIGKGGIRVGRRVTRTTKRGKG